LIEKSVEKFSIHLKKICVSWEGTKCGLFTRIKTTLAKQGRVIKSYSDEAGKNSGFSHRKSNFPTTHC
jgi:hypothetical protein